MFRVEPANKGNNLLSLQKGTNSKHSSKILWRYVRLRHRGPTSVKPRLTLANHSSAGINRGWTAVEPRLNRGLTSVLPQFTAVFVRLFLDGTVRSNLKNIAFKP